MRIQFGDYLFDSELRILRRAGEAIHLTPKAFQLLQLLIRRRPQPVAKDELMATLWPDCFVTEANLSNLISLVRTALDDTARPSRFVRTLHRYGYAFVAACTAAPDVGLDTRAALLVDDREIGLCEGENLLGRGAECGVRLGAATVSRRHARLVLLDRRALIEDLGSKNGTFVSGERIHAPRLLADCDELRLGAVRLVYRVLRTDTPTVRCRLIPDLARAR